MPVAGPFTMRVRDEFSTTHPALAGHFPGNPIVPGVLILSSVCRALIVHGLRAHGNAIAAVPVVKFHAPLRPAEPFDMDLERSGADRYRFRVMRAETLIASGTVLVSAAAR